MFGPAWHCLTQFDVQADSVLQMVLDLGRYLDNHPIPDHEDIVNIIKEIVGTIVTSVNGKTGEVNLKLSDVTGTDSWPVWILTNAEYGEISDATMLDAYDNDGFRLLYVTSGDDPEKEPAFLMIPGRTFNPDGITRYIFTGGGGSGGGAVQSVNGKVGAVVLTADDVGALPDTYVPPAPPVTSVNTKTGEVVLSASDVGAATPADVSEVDAKVDTKYGPDNVPPYPVTSVNTKTGAVTLSASDVGAATSADVANKYGPDNPPPYPVTSVNDYTGAIKNLARGRIEGSSAVFRPYDNDTFGLFVSPGSGLIVRGTTGGDATVYSTVNPPPAPTIGAFRAVSTTGTSGDSGVATPIAYAIGFNTIGAVASGLNFVFQPGVYLLSLHIPGVIRGTGTTDYTVTLQATSGVIFSYSSWVWSGDGNNGTNSAVFTFPTFVQQFTTTTTFSINLTCGFGFGTGWDTSRSIFSAVKLG